MGKAFKRLKKIKSNKLHIYHIYYEIQHFMLIVILKNQQNLSPKIQSCNKYDFNSI